MTAECNNRCRASLDCPAFLIDYGLEVMITMTMWMMRVMMMTRGPDDDDNDNDDDNDDVADPLLTVPFFSLITGRRQSCLNSWNV